MPYLLIFELNFEITYICLIEKTFKAVYSIYKLMKSDSIFYKILKSGNVIIHFRALPKKPEKLRLISFGTYPEKNYIY